MSSVLKRPISRTRRQVPHVVQSVRFGKLTSKSAVEDADIEQEIKDKKGKGVENENLVGMETRIRLEMRIRVDTMSRRCCINVEIDFRLVVELHLRELVTFLD
eukprot:1263193-Amorphochlora_amoeboformis.AAC.1